MLELLFWGALILFVLGVCEINWRPGRRHLGCLKQIERREVALKRAGAFESWDLHTDYEGGPSYLKPRYRELRLPRD